MSPSPWLEDRGLREADLAVRFDRVLAAASLDDRGDRTGVGVHAHVHVDRPDHVAKIGEGITHDEDGIGRHGNCGRDPSIPHSVVASRTLGWRRNRHTHFRAGSPHAGAARRGAAVSPAREMAAPFGAPDELVRGKHLLLGGTRWSLRRVLP